MRRHSWARLPVMGVAVAAHVAVLFGSTPAWCWGREGHRVVAKIAAKGLTPAVRGKVAAIFGVHAANVEAAMARAATWPDEIDKKRTGTADWHFIDVPISAPFSVSGLCPKHACVVDQIQDLQRRLQTNASGFKLARSPNPTHPMTWQ